MNINEKYNICIVGLGVNSIYLYYHLRTKFTNILILEKNSNIEQTYKDMENELWDTPTAQLFPLEYNKYLKIPTSRHITSREIGVYLDNLFNKIKLNNTKILFNTEVKKVKNINNVCLLECENKHFFSHKVVLNVGWNIKHLEDLIHPKVSKTLNYIKYLSNGLDIQNKKIVLIGSSYAGVEFIRRYLSKNKIIWIIRNKHHYESEPNKLKALSKRAYNSSIQKEFINTINLYKRNLTIHRCEPKFFYEKKILLENDIMLDDFDFCFIKIGYDMKNNKLITNSNILTKNNWIYCEKEYSTNIKNVFLFGSCLSNSFITHKSTKLKESCSQNNVYVRDQEKNKNNILKLLLND